MNLGIATRTHVKSVSAEDEDRDLAVRFGRGDSLAFDAVVDCYAQRVTSLAARLLGWREGAEDVAQEVFLAALRNQRRFRGESTLWTWLAKMTVNRCRSVQRRRWIFDKFMAATGSPVRESSEQTPPGQRLERDDVAQQVRSAVGQLTIKQREVIVLRYLEELSVEQIAELLGERRNTIEVRLTRAKKLLEPLLTEMLRDEQ